MAERVWFKPKPGLKIPDGLGGIFPPQGGWTEKNLYLTRRLDERMTDGTIGAGEIYDRDPYAPEPEPRPAPQPAPHPVVHEAKQPKASRETPASEFKLKKTGQS